MKKELKLIMFQANKMFDLEKLVDKNPSLFAEICEKYPLKKECVYMIKYEREEVVDAQPKVEVEQPQETMTLVAEDNPDCNEPFQPLYNIGEEIKINYDYGKIVEHIKILDFKYEVFNGTPKYYYTYLVLENNETKTMGEEWLIDHEVIAE